MMAVKRIIAAAGSCAVMASAAYAVPNGTKPAGGPIATQDRDIRLIEERAFDASTLKEIRAGVRTESLRIAETDAAVNEVRVIFSGWSLFKAKYLISVENGTLEARYLWRFPGPSRRLALEVQVPRGWKGRLSLRSGTGRFGSGDLHVGELFADSGTGGISMGAVEASKVTLRNSTGSIALGSIRADEAALSVSTGSIAIGAIEAPSLSVDSSTGSVSLGDCLAKDAKITTSTGPVSISFRSFKDTRLDLRSSTGSVKIDLPKDELAFISAKSSTGGIQSDLPVGEGSALSIHTSTGSITVKTR